MRDPFFGGYTNPYDGDFCRRCKQLFVLSGHVWGRRHGRRNIKTHNRDETEEGQIEAEVSEVPAINYLLDTRTVTRDLCSGGSKLQAAWGKSSGQMKNMG